MKIYLFILIGLIGTCISCGEKERTLPSNVLGKQKMINVMIDIHLIEANLSHKNLPRDSAVILYALYKKDLYRKHEIADSIYDLSFEYYTHYPSVLEGLYSSVIDSLTYRAGKQK